MSKQCEVCNENASKYKCPACRIKYCSVKCFQAHKQTTCAPASVAPAPQPSATVETANALAAPEAQETEMQIETAAPAPASAVATDAAAVLAPMELLGAEQKLALERSEWLHDILRSERLQQHIQAIVSAPNSQATLRAARSNPEFDQFVGELLNQLER